jgi:hypothetical protein
VLKIHFGVVPCHGRLVVLADGLAGSVQSKSEKRRSGRGDEAGEPGSPFIPPPHVGGYGRLHGYGEDEHRFFVGACLRARFTMPVSAKTNNGFL